MKGPLTRKNDKLILLGTAPTMDSAPLSDDSFDVWAVSAYASHRPALLPSVDVLFEMHAEYHWMKPHVFERLRAFHGPVVMQEAEPEFPNAVEYPFEEIEKQFYIPAMGEFLYATNSVVYMLMLGYLLGYTEYHLHGIHMSHSSEYGYQKPSCEYYLGFLAAKGCTVRVPDAGSLLQAPYLYGYNEPWKEFAALRNDRDRYEKEVSRYDRELEELKARRWRAQGMKEYADMIAHTRGAY